MKLAAIRSATIILVGMLAVSGCGKSDQSAADQNPTNAARETQSSGAVIQASHTTSVSDPSSDSHLPERQPQLMRAQGNAAVLDLNRVAIGLGRIEGFETRLQAKRKELEAQIKILEDGYQEEIEDLKRNGSDEAAGADIADSVAEKERERDLNLGEARRQAAQQLLQFEDLIKREFMDEVRPIAFQVALDNGFGVVFTVPQVFAFQVDSQVDITERVVEQMKATNPSQPNSTLPRLASPISSETTR